MPGRVTRIENRTGQPLALDGVLHQMGKVAEIEGDERGLFFRTMVEQSYDDYSAVIAVEDAHTLTTLALTALARVPGLGGPDQPGMILMLMGEAGLLEKLEGPGLGVLRNSRRTLMVSLLEPGVGPAAAMAEGRLPGSMPRSSPGSMPGSMPRSIAGSPPGQPLGETTEVHPAKLGLQADELGWARGNLGLRAVVIALLAGAIAAASGLSWSVMPSVKSSTPAAVTRGDILGGTPDPVSAEARAANLLAAGPPNGRRAYG
jgi:hypothetical protein